MSEVVVTGMSLITPFGEGLDLNWQAFLDGRSCISRVEGFDTVGLRSTIAALLNREHLKAKLSPTEFNRLDPSTQLSLVGSKEVIDMAGLSQKELALTGVLIGTGFGAILTKLDTFVDRFVEKKPIYPLSIPKGMDNALSSEVAIKFGCHGFNQSIFTACSAGQNAIGQGYRLIKDGYADSMIVGGVDCYVNDFSLRCWDRMRVLSTRNDDPAAASRPFTASRDGFVLSEGTGFLMLENKELAEKRGANIFGKISGYATNCDAKHITTPCEQQQAKAIKAALSDAHKSPEDIHYINAHGTSTASNDLAETNSIKAAFGSAGKTVPVSGLKSNMGHSIGASGAIESILTLMMMEKGIILPTVNYQDPDPECDINVIGNQPREAVISSAMTNAFAFGGNNAVLILERG